MFLIKWLPSHLGTQLGEDRSTSHVANRLVGTGTRSSVASAPDPVPSVGQTAPRTRPASAAIVAFRATGRSDAGERGGEDPPVGGRQEDEKSVFVALICCLPARTGTGPRSQQVPVLGANWYRSWIVSEAGGGSIHGAQAGPGVATNTLWSDTFSVFIAFGFSLLIHWFNNI